MINIDSRLPRELDGDELKLLAILADYSNKDRTCWPSVKTLALDCKWSMPKVNRVKRSLISKGLIAATARYKPNDPGQTSNLYTIVSTHIQKYTPLSNLNGGVVQNQRGEVSKTDRGPGVNSEGDPPSPVCDEVLGNEALTNEVLTNEVLGKEDSYAPFCVHSIFGCLVKNILTQFEDYAHCMAGYAEISECKEITDPTIRKSLEKILAAARAIYSAFGELKRPLPEWRETSSIFGTSAKEVDPRREAIDQIQAYADFCRISGEYMTKTPEKLPEKIVGTDWCEALRDHAQGDVERGRYDPAKDPDLLSEWLLEQYYFQSVDVYVCKRQENRIVFEGEEYRKVGTYAYPEPGRKKYSNRGKIQ